MPRVVPVAVTVVSVHVHCNACGYVGDFPRIDMLPGWALAHRMPEFVTISYRLGGRLYVRPWGG